MQLPDVNVLVYAHRKDVIDHERYRDWLLELINGDEPYRLSDLILSGVIRVVTNPRAFNQPSSISEALTFAADIRNRANCVPVAPGPMHWEIFTRLCKEARARGNLVPDAYFAALAIESGSEWITDDGDFARFPGLRWRRPFEA